MPRFKYITVPLQEALDDKEYMRDTWCQRLAHLKDNEAGKVAGLPRHAAGDLRNSILGSLRAARSNLKVHTKVVRDGELFAVYFWRDDERAKV